MSRSEREMGSKRHESKGMRKRGKEIERVIKKSAQVTQGRSR